MIGLPCMLVEPAKRVGMKVPENPDEFCPDDYPHFNVFLKMQLGASMPRMSCHWSNAEVVADIPIDKIKTITFAELIELGFEVGYPIP